MSNNQQCVAETISWRLSHLTSLSLLMSFSWQPLLLVSFLLRCPSHPFLAFLNLSQLFSTLLFSGPKPAPKLELGARTKSLWFRSFCRKEFQTAPERRRIITRLMISNPGGATPIRLASSELPKKNCAGNGDAEKHWCSHSNKNC